MIKVCKFYKPSQLDPGASESFVVEDMMETAQFLFLPEIRIHNPTNGYDCQIELKYIFELGYGDDPLWSGTETYVDVNETIPPGSYRKYQFAPQLDTNSSIITQHTVTITNLDPTNERIIKTLLFGLTEVSVNISNNQGVIVTRHT